MVKKIKISDNIKENEKYIRERCRNCADILIRPMLSLIHISEPTRPY